MSRPSERGGAVAARTALEVVAGGPAWVQDAGRPGRMHEGIPPGGALVPEALAAANRALGNPPGAAAIEAFGSLVVAARGGDVSIAWGGAAAVLPRDHVRTLAPTGPVTYLAVAGGLDVPEVLGGRGLLAVAELGGGPGRALRGGDRVAVGLSEGRGAHRARGGVEPEKKSPRRRPWRPPAPKNRVPGPPAVPPKGGPTAGPGPQGAVGHPGRRLRFLRRLGLLAEPDPNAPIRVLPGPDLDRFAPGALEDFLARTWEVGVGDRVGTRLSGPPVERVGGDRAPSAPMVRGAIQVPGGGSPVVLGPDHPTTGGYPVLAVVIAADHGRLAARPRGAPVRFVAVDLAEARAATEAWRRRQGFVAPGPTGR